MNELVPSFGFIAFLFAGCAFGIGIMLCSVQRSYRTQLNSLKGTLATELVMKRQMEEDFRALLACSRNMGKKIVQTTQLPEPSTPVKHNFNVDPTEISTGDKVHELVAHGLSVEEVASICGLTRGEVDFLSRFIDAGDSRSNALH